MLSRRADAVSALAEGRCLESRDNGYCFGFFGFGCLGVLRHPHTIVLLSQRLVARQCKPSVSDVSQCAIAITPALDANTSAAHMVPSPQIANATAHAPATQAPRQ